MPTENDLPPPYFPLADHLPHPPSLDDNPQSTSTHDLSGIPLLPLHSQPAVLDQAALRVYQRAMEDYQRSSSPSHWGRYRHGKLLIPFDEPEKPLILELIRMIAKMFAPPELILRNHQSRMTTWGMVGTYGVY
ncbi:uncharacterized protein I303_100432 [Kwoniella dejecticola CBS 10117]|uniref:Uncharacterized protein n=1 Tax=Kwoniella dejecticola CBS 10117 TaxID=1296121 RepID=A0A1A6AEY8_9TREE|nr:uncharacterized protein I303_00431 [Kwoniella dejecticola CBS 10117]OBR88614.1 hypothetical protein I303_00431 [Kwoniella dejecticola CBS 10117]